MAVTWNTTIESRVVEAAANGMLEATEALLALAVDQTPWVEHTLRNSGTTSVEINGNEVHGAVGFNTPYARRQHEELDWNHPNGGNAKFLEKPANQFGPEMLAIVGYSVGRALT